MSSLPPASPTRPQEVPSMPLLNRPEEARENVASLAAVPAAILPRGAARDYLVCRAAEGYDVYAYEGVSGIWNCWLEGMRLCLVPLGDETQSQFARYWAHHLAKDGAA